MTSFGKPISYKEKRKETWLGKKRKNGAKKKKKGEHFRKRLEVVHS